MAASAGTVDDSLTEQIRQGNAVFSAFRTHRMQNDMARRLLDSDGRLKRFDVWMRDIRDISGHYVRSWLQTEYSTAVIRARQAADWRHFEQEADVLPNLRWMPTTSPSPESEHRQYWERKLTLPVGDPFWDRHRPGDRWNCKCSLMQTDEPATPGGASGLRDTPGQPGLDSNPGKDGQIFSRTHPYYTQAYPGAEKAVNSAVLRERLDEMIRRTVESFPSGRTARIGRLDSDVMSFVRKRGIDPVSEELYVSDHRIAHALRADKASKGKAVSPDRMRDALAGLEDLEVYWDDRMKNLWFVETEGNTACKYVFRLNERIKADGGKITANAFITAGIINKRNLNMAEIHKIK